MRCYVQLTWVNLWTWPLLYKPKLSVLVGHLEEERVPTGDMSRNQLAVQRKASVSSLFRGLKYLVKVFYISTVLQYSFKILVQYLSISNLWNIIVLLHYIIILLFTPWDIWTLAAVSSYFEEKGFTCKLMKLMHFQSASLPTLKRK